MLSTNNSLTNYIYLRHINEQDLALNNLQRLICRKTQSTHTYTHTYILCVCVCVCLYNAIMFLFHHFLFIIRPCVSIILREVDNLISDSNGYFLFWFGVSTMKPTKLIFDIEYQIILHRNRGKNFRWLLRRFTFVQNKYCRLM